MESRYIVTRWSWSDGETLKTTHAFGRYRSLDEAETAAKSKFAEYGPERLSVRPESRTEAALFAFARVIVRSLRIISGAALAIVAWSIADLEHNHIGNVPFAELTIDAVLRGVLRAGLLFGALWGGWTLAFGDGPKY